jgi:hypothetical protein
MRGADVDAVDDITSVHQAREHEQHVAWRRVFGRHRPQHRRDAGGRVGAQHHRLAEVAGVATVAGDGRWREAEAVVVVLDGDHRTGPVDAHGAAPAGGESADRLVQQQLHRVRSGGRIGQITQLERGGDLGG